MVRAKVSSLALEAAGYGAVISKKLYIAVKHFRKKLKPVRLYKKVLAAILWRKNERFDKGNFEWIIWKVVIQAKKLQSKQRGAHILKYR